MNRLLNVVLICLGSAVPLHGAADIYIRAATLPAKRLNVVVGNAGNSPNASRFDAFLEVRSAEGLVCSARTNFVTPLDPRTSVATFAVDNSGPGSAARIYYVSARIRFWDDADENRDNDSATATISVSAVPQCLTLKPPQ